MNDRLRIVRVRARVRRACVRVREWQLVHIVPEVERHITPVAPAIERIMKPGRRECPRFLLTRRRQSRRTAENLSISIRRRCDKAPYACSFSIFLVSRIADSLLAATSTTIRDQLERPGVAERRPSRSYERG